MIQVPVTREVTTVCPIVPLLSVGYRSPCVALLRDGFASLDRRPLIRDQRLRGIRSRSASRMLDR